MISDEEVTPGTEGEAETAAPESEEGEEAAV